MHELVHSGTAVAAGKVYGVSLFCWAKQSSRMSRGMDWLKTLAFPPWSIQTGIPLSAADLAIPKTNMGIGMD